MQKLRNRYLLAFIDTEGGILETPLRQISLLFNFTIKADKDFKNVKCEEQVFHLLNFQLCSDKNKPNLNSQLYAMKLLQKRHSCEGIVCIAWNAVHDARVLSKYIKNDNIFFADAISWAKRITKFPSYKQQNIMKQYDMGVQDHSSLMDCIDMMEIMKFIQLDYETKGKLSVEDLKIEAKLQGAEGVLRRIIDSNILKPFSINSVSSEKDKYSYYEMLGEKYKIRTGFVKSETYKGYGLYEHDAIKDRYVLIKDKTKKKNIIEAIIDKFH